MREIYDGPSFVGVEGISYLECMLGSFCTVEAAVVMSYNV